MKGMVTALMDIIEEALSKGQKALNEYDAKRFCSSSSIPVCREAMANGADSAAKEAVRIGFPVVLKASGKELLHKTEVGGISLNLKSQEEVKQESERLLRIPGSEAVLVQEMVKGERELVCGLVRDGHFGPCVMFGLGGIMTEVFQDIVFRVAPLTTQDAREMVQEIRGYPLLRGVRGQRAVDIEGIIDTLLRISQLVTDFPEVVELDINPLLVRDEGRGVVGIDMRLVLS